MVMEMGTSPMASWVVRRGRIKKLPAILTQNY
jgi:hypothetical protein